MGWLRKHQFANLQGPEWQAALKEAEPILLEIDELLSNRGLSTWVVLVALAMSLGKAAAIAVVSSPVKGYLRVVHILVDFAFETTKAELSRSEKQ